MKSEADEVGELDVVRCDGCENDCFDEVLDEGCGDCFRGADSSG